jgi:hypothetical protein
MSCCDELSCERLCQTTIYIPRKQPITTSSSEGERERELDHSLESENEGDRKRRRLERKRESLRYTYSIDYFPCQITPSKF